MLCKSREYLIFPVENDRQRKGSKRTVKMSVLSCVFALIFVIKLWSNSNKCVSEFIKKRYGQNNLSLYRKYEDALCQLKKAELDVKFLETCKIYNVIPKFLRFKLHRKTLLSASFYKGWQHKLLVSEINFKKQAVKRLISQSEQLKACLYDILLPIDRLCINNFVKKTCEKLHKTIITTHEKKLLSLGIKRGIDPCDPEKVIFNYSNVKIPPRIKYLLAFGLDFGLPTFKLDFAKFFLSFEKLVHSLKNVSSSTEHSELCRRLKLVSHKYFYGFKSCKIFSIFKKEDITNLQKFGEKEDIVIAKPDKGNGIVVVQKSHYMEGMLKIISNSAKFEMVTEEVKRVSWLLEDKLNNFLLNLKNLGHISPTLYKQLYVTGTGPGILYGLAKVFVACNVARFYLLGNSWLLQTVTKKFS